MDCLPVRDRLTLRRVGRGFTLLELLVVVVILGVLLAVLLPALSKARERARKVACGEQLRGLGTGMKTYLSENNDVMPRSAQMPSVNAGYEALPVTLVQQVPDKRSWRCPGDVVGYLRLSDGQYFASYFLGETTSYEYNLGLGGKRVERWFLFGLLGDHGTFVLADLDHFHGLKGSTTGKNVLFSDGHIGNIDEITESLGGPTGF